MHASQAASWEAMATGTASTGAAGPHRSGTSFTAAAAVASGLAGHSTSFTMPSGQHTTALAELAAGAGGSAGSGGGALHRPSHSVGLPPQAPAQRRDLREEDGRDPTAQQVADGTLSAATAAELVAASATSWYSFSSGKPGVHGGSAEHMTGGGLGGFRRAGRASQISMGLSRMAAQHHAQLPGGTSTAPTASKPGSVAGASSGEVGPHPLGLSSGQPSLHGPRTSQPLPGAPPGSTGSVGGHGGAPGRGVSSDLGSTSQPSSAQVMGPALGGGSLPGPGGLDSGQEVIPDVGGAAAGPSAGLLMRRQSQHFEDMLPVGAGRARGPGQRQRRMSLTAAGAVATLVGLAPHADKAGPASVPALEQGGLSEEGPHGSGPMAQGLASGRGSSTAGVQPAGAGSEGGAPAAAAGVAAGHGRKVSSEADIAWAEAGLPEVGPATRPPQTSSGGGATVAPPPATDSPAAEAAAAVPSAGAAPLAAAAALDAGAAAASTTPTAGAPPPTQAAAAEAAARPTAGAAAADTLTAPGTAAAPGAGHAPKVLRPRGVLRAGLRQQPQAPDPSIRNQASSGLEREEGQDQVSRLPRFARTTTNIRLQPVGREEDEDGGGDQEPGWVAAARARANAARMRRQACLTELAGSHGNTSALAAAVAAGNAGAGGGGPGSRLPAGLLAARVSRLSEAQSSYLGEEDEEEEDEGDESLGLSGSLLPSGLGSLLESHHRASIDRHSQPFGAPRRDSNRRQQQHGLHSYGHGGMGPLARPSLTHSAAPSSQVMGTLDDIVLPAAARARGSTATRGGTGTGTHRSSSTKGGSQKPAVFLTPAEELEAALQPPQNDSFQFDVDYDI